MKLDSSLAAALTEELGPHLRGATRRWFSQEKQRLPSAESFLAAPPEEQQFVVDILALASFYRAVIAPVACTAAVGNLLKKADVPKILIGRQEISEDYPSCAEKVAKDFRTFITRNHIPQSLLEYSALETFILDARRLYKDMHR